MLKVGSSDGYSFSAAIVYRSRNEIGNHGDFIYIHLIGFYVMESCVGIVFYPNVPEPDSNSGEVAGRSNLGAGAIDHLRSTSDVRFPGFSHEYLGVTLKVRPINRHSLGRGVINTGWRSASDVRDLNYRGGVRQGIGMPRSVIYLHIPEANKSARKIASGG